MAFLNLSFRHSRSLFIGFALINALRKVILWGKQLRKRHSRVTSTSTRLRRYRPWIGAIVLFLLITWSRSPQDLVSIANAATVIKTPLFTKGSQIVDATGATILLRGVNWFGMETDLHVPHGLWARDYKEMLAQIKNLGYNVIRLPYSVQALRSSNISGVDFSIGSNNDLNGKTPLEVMDLVVQEAGRQGLFILLDSHRLNDQQIPELWYGDGFTETDWIDTWKTLATRYKNQTNVIGADLKNEPHGRASWGTDDQSTDWRLAAERAGNAIQAINPNWLIVVEGVESNVPGQQLSGHWQGGNLEGVKKYPVRLSTANKLVYSPHEYGAGVYNQPWFSDSAFPQNLYSRWEIGFNYIATQGIAPILIGEFGGRQVDSSSKEGIWQRQFVDYIDQNKLSFTYWSWNPNSGDTGGILQDDWKSVNAPKQELLSKLLSGSGSTQGSTPTSTPTTDPASSSTSPTSTPTTDPASSSTSPTSTPTTDPASSSTSPTSTPTTDPSRTPTTSTSPDTTPQLKAEAIIQSDWETGFCVNLRVTNQGNASTTNWHLTFDINQATITSAWSANFIPQGTKYEVTPESWGQIIQPNQTLESGYCANKLGSNYKPTQVLATSL